MRELDGWANVTRAIAARELALTSQAPDAAAQRVAGAAGEGGRPQVAPTIEQLVLLETNIDHQTPEALSFACEELLAAGALDVWQEPITMKKGRLAVRLSALAKPRDASRLTTELITHTGSLGVRASLVERASIPRQLLDIETPYGQIPFKLAGLQAAEVFDQPSVDQANTTPNLSLTWLRPEHDSVAFIARQQNKPYQLIQQELTHQAATQLSRQQTQLGPRYPEQSA
jgi:uncharacterized protein (DUF111 family)